MFYFAGTRKPDFTKISRIDYDEYWRSRGFTINEKLKEREVIMFNLIPKGSSVFDAGSGNSRLPLALKEKGCQVSVGDVSTEVLKGFEEHSITVVHFDLEDVKSLKLTDKFDYVILSEVLEHTRNPEEILAALSSFANRFFLTIPNSAFYRYRMHLMFSGRFFTQWVHHPSEHLRYWSHKDFLDWLKALGFVVEMSESSNGLSLLGLPLYKWWPNLFGHQIVYLVRSKGI